MPSTHISSDYPTGGTLDLAQSGNPITATPLNSSSGNVAAASAVGTLAAAAGRLNFCTGFEITGAGATAASVVVATLAGILGGTQSYIVTVPAGATVGINPLVVEFSKPLPASAVNTAIVLTLPSLGAGNTNAAVCLHGYRV